MSSERPGPRAGAGGAGGGLPHGETRAVYVISVAAELAGVHPQTLRIYERKGLIEPERTPGRSRRYSESDIALLRRIQELTNAGVSLAGVARILDLEDRVARLEEQLDHAHRRYRRELVPWRGGRRV